MKSITKVLLAIIAIFLTAGCEKNSYNQQDIKGIWAAVTNDTLYEEIIITDTTFYLWDDNGDFYLTYELTADSIKLFYSGNLQSARLYTRINRDEFIESDEKYHVRFVRIPDYGDTARILGIDTISSDSEYFYNYTQQKLLRQLKWDSLKNASR